MELKCKYCGNTEKFYESGRFSGYYEVTYDGNGEYLNDFSNAEIHDNAEYFPNKKIRCCDCKKIVCDHKDLVK